MWQSRTSTTPDTWPHPIIACAVKKALASTGASAHDLGPIGEAAGGCRGRAIGSDSLRQILTKAYTPKTNGKAERFIQTVLREWACAQASHDSDRRSAELPDWLHRNNRHPPYGSVRSKPPINRCRLAEDNLLKLDT